LCSHSCKLKSVRLNQGKAVFYKRMCKQNTKKIIRQTKEGTGRRLADTLLEFQALNLSHSVEDCLPDIFSLVIRIQRTKATGNKCPKSGECTTDLAGQQLNGFSSDTDSLCNTDDAAYCCAAAFASVSECASVCVCVCVRSSAGPWVAPNCKDCK